MVAVDFLVVEAMWAAAATALMVLVIDHGPCYGEGQDGHWLP